ncbi:hypothetical protein ABZ318_26420 [Streptomyces sp. NPDC006197]|uniref:hypothetical protein n=1 Tax=Streptomyces sp. NPDC006197 TaxID=3156685 RepID=UPI0033A65800
MNLTRRISAVSATAVMAIVMGSGSVQAQDNGGLLSLLGTTSLLQVCYPAGQVGQGNTFTGSQTISCAQNSTQTSTTPSTTPPTTPPTAPPTGIQTTAVLGPSVGVPAGGSATSTAVCPAGERPVSGGWQGTTGLVVDSSRRVATNAAADSWQVSAFNPSGSDGTIRAIAYCAPTS